MSGQKGDDVTGVAISLLIFAVIGIVGVLVFSNFYDALPTLTGTANTTVVSFATNFYSGVNLLGIALIVMGAVAIIGVVLWLRGTST